MNDSYEKSDFGGVPIELYLFTIGSGAVRTEVCLTNHDMDVVAMGRTFFSEVIDRPDITIDNDHTSDQRFGLDVDAGSRIALQFFYAAPSEGDTLDLYRCQIADVENTLLYVWRGMLVGVERNYPSVTISCQSLKSIYNSTGCYSRYQRGRCRHRFMEPDTCKYTEPDYFGVFNKTGDRTYALVSPAQAPEKGMSYYLGGVFEFGGQIRTIMEVDGGNYSVTLDLPLTITAASDDFPDQYTAVIRPGCDLSMDTCLTKFDNINNYGGYDDMPVGSGPFGGVPLYAGSSGLYSEWVEAMQGLNEAKS